MFKTVPGTSFDSPVLRISSITWNPLMKSGLLVATTATTLMTTMGCTNHLINTKISTPRIVAPSILLVQSNWQPFTSTHGRFMAQFPGQPKIETIVKDIRGHLSQCNQASLMNDTGVYSIIYCDLSEELIRQKEPQALLEDMGNWILNDKQLEDLAGLEQPIFLKRNPGQEFRISNANSALVVRLYLVEKRIYFLLTGSENVSDVNHFLGSFQLL